MLDILGRLTSEIGNTKTGRKAKPGMREHRTAEWEWMGAAVRLLIRRVGAVTARARPLSTITMGDLPAR